ncbi:MAG: 2-amino-4-hydroxy-6-hydroxymethyldihydropteridine diphosphokinase [Gammaproteobacteria bacterium]
MSDSEAGWVKAFIGLGSNLGEPKHQVEEAITSLGLLADCRLIAHSSLYESDPMGPPDQPRYVNAVALLMTGLSAGGLLSTLQRIEDAHHRDRTVGRWGPRTLDLDLLLFGDQHSNDPKLILPHPGLTERNFVVYPLAQIAPQLVLPDGSTAAQLADRLGGEGLREIKGTEIQ